MTGCVRGLHEIAIGRPWAYRTVEVDGRGYGGNGEISSAGLSAIHLVTGDVRADSGRRRVPLQQNAVWFVVGPDSEKHCAYDPNKKDRQNRQRQTQCSLQWEIVLLLIHQRPGFGDASFDQFGLNLELLMSPQIDHGFKWQISG